MHLPSFGNCVDRAVEEVLVGLLNLKMFGSGTKKWFVKKQKRHPQHRRPCTRKKKRWAAKILKQHRQKILSELDVNTVLPYLVYDKVFSLGEYKEILGHESSKRRTEIFLDHLSSKGPAAFCSFCSVLEEVCPHLLTSFLLDEKGTSIDQRLITLMSNTKHKGHRGPCCDVLFENHLSVSYSSSICSFFHLCVLYLHLFHSPGQIENKKTIYKGKKTTLQ